MEGQLGATVFERIIHHCLQPWGFAFCTALTSTNQFALDPCQKHLSRDDNDLKGLYHT